MNVWKCFLSIKYLMSVRQYYSSNTPKRQLSIKWKKNRDKYKEGSDLHEFPLHLSSNKIHIVILSSKSSLLKTSEATTEREIQHQESIPCQVTWWLWNLQVLGLNIWEVFPLFNPGELWPFRGNTETQLTWKRPSKVIFETGREWLISPETGPEFVLSSHPEVFSSLPQELEKLIN